MTALILFTRELVAELERTVAIVREEAKSLEQSTDPSDQIVFIAARCTADTISYVARAVSVASKKAFHL